MAAARPNILTVDDDPLVLDLLRLYLWDFDVSCVASGSAALSMLSSARPALILLDVRMPGMDGLQTLKRIRQRPYLASSPVLMLTAAADRPTIAKAIEAGASGYMLKPFTRDTLMRRVNRFLQRSSDDLVFI